MNADATITRAPQHLRALARANEVRLARASLKKRVADGEISVADVILSTPWEAETMPVLDLLMSQRRWGLTRCRRFLQLIPMTESKTIGTMTDRQRQAMARMLVALPVPGAATATRRLEAAPAA
jgi:hypothetical protein